jgi:ABC-type multidrug transport system fused ATPase/permease subunit
VLTLVRYAFTLHRGFTIALVALAIAAAGLSVLLTTLIGQVVGAVPAAVRGGSYTSFALLFGALVAVFPISSVVPLLHEPVILGLIFQSHRAVARRVATAVLQPVRSAHLDDPEVQNHIERARGTNTFNVEFGLSNLYHAISARLTAIGLATVVGVLFSWWVGLGLLVSVALLGQACAWAIGKEFDSFFTKTDDRRRSEYLFELGMGPAAAELRVFGLSGWLVRRHHGHWSDALRPLWKARRQAGISALLAFGLHAVVAAGALALVGQAALAGSLSLAATATLVPTVLRMAIAQDGQAVATMRRGLVALRAMRDLPALIAERHPDPAGETEASGLSPAPVRAIRFERVCFRYPGGDRDVLHDLELEIRAGEALALVRWVGGRGALASRRW